MFRSALRFCLEISILAVVLIALSFTAGAKEESKIRTRLTNMSENGDGYGNGDWHGSGHGNEHGNGSDGGTMRVDVRTHLQGTKVILKLRARGLDANTEYVLLCKDTEDATDSAELARFTSRSNGSANVTQNLSKSDDVDAPADPRGKFVVVANGADSSMEIVGGWLYGEPLNDGPMTRIKEVTDLAPDADASPVGRVAARYDRRPNGDEKFSISMRGVPAGDYEVFVDGMPVAALTPNRAGHAKADFQTRPIRGHGSGMAKPHRMRQQMNFVPRRREILVQLTDETPMFLGSMIAQIEGLNTCSATSTDSPLTGDTGSGVAALEIEKHCETVFDVDIADVPAGSYDLYVDEALVATFDAADDGSGTVTGFARFDPTPDAGENELILDFPVGSGSLVEVFNMGADPNVDLPVLSGTLL